MIPPAENAPTPEQPILFYGTARDYFPVGTNTLLRIATLGVYGAWATANDRRYFWGATNLDGVGFERHDQGWAILRAGCSAV